ncbi:MAG: phosphinothricin acetyltransferase [Pedobacter sp.]|jgi:L-amino acid N-acyltransferase YncA|nr:phosphinothricin acetyltransferase [Pedobacter sp.]
MTKIDVMSPEDWGQVKRIYEEGIATGQATFQTEAPDWSQWDSSHLEKMRFVLREGDQIAGWVALSPVSGRCIYSGVAEVSIYIGEQHRGKKYGDQLLLHLIKESEKHNIWTIQAGIFPENTASVKLHLKHGFRLIGLREKLGKQNGVWRDVGILERRSQVVGVD